MADPKKPERRLPSNPHVTGPTRRVETTQPVTAPVRRAGEPARPAGRPELVTEGMKAHRREIERRKRQKALERLHGEEKAADARRTFLKVAGWLAFLLAVGLGYQRLQAVYGNQWPVAYVWLLLGTSIFGVIAWMLWYFNKADL